MLTMVMPVSAQAADNSPGSDSVHHPSAEKMIVDGLVYRPLSLAGTLVGTGLFLVTLPFSLISGSADEAGQALVVEPANTTFNNCLGCQPDYTSVHYHPGD